MEGEAAQPNHPLTPGQMWPTRFIDTRREVGSATSVQTLPRKAQGPSHGAPPAGS